MKLPDLMKACQEFAANPDEFGFDAMADIIHGFADDADDGELLDFAKLLQGKTE